MPDTGGYTMGKKVPPSVKMEQELYTGLITSGDPLGEAARRRARPILQKDIEAEVEQFLGDSTSWAGVGQRRMNGSYAYLEFASEVP
jgi:hypothetical protein